MRCQQMDFLHRLVFASEADVISLAGVGFLLFALIAMAADRARAHRERLQRLDRVGWVPWTMLFMASAIIGGGLLALALPKALFGS